MFKKNSTICKLAKAPMRRYITHLKEGVLRRKADKQLFLMAALLYAQQLHAAPFVVSESTPQTVTHCGIVVDTAAKVDSPVVSDTTGKWCKYDIGSVAVGTHTIKATFVNIDPLWGRNESVFSLPFSFTKPAALAIQPTGLVLIPN